MDALDPGLFWHPSTGFWLEYRKHESLAATSAGTCGKLSGFFTSKSFSRRQKGTVISKSIFKSSQKFVNFIANLPFDYSKINLKIGEKSKFCFDPEEWELKFVFDEEDVPKEKILKYIENIFLYIGTFKGNFSTIKFIGRNYSITIKYVMNCYAVIKSWGLSAEQEIEFLSVPGNIMDRVRFSGNFLCFDITQSELMENLVNVQFEEKNDFLYINKNEIEKISNNENKLVRYFRENKPDYLGNLLKKF